MDLTDMLKQAPHGEEVFSSFTEVGNLEKMDDEQGLSLYEKLFYGIAYLNMGLVLIIILIVTLWKI